MNKRQLKKYQNRSRVSNELLKMVSKYTAIHHSVDLCGGIRGVSHIIIDKSDIFNYYYLPKMSLSEYKQIENLCQKLFYETNKIVTPGESVEWLLDKQYNYRIVKKAFGYYCSKFDKNEVEIMGYYVNQWTIIDDFYQGTVYLPLKNGKYLAYDYEC